MTRWANRGTAVAVVAAVAVLAAVVVLVTPDRTASLLLVSGLALVAVAVGLTHPVVATAYLLVAIFLRLAVPDGILPVDVFVLAFGGVLGSVGLWWRTRREPSPPLGLLGVLVAAYLAWSLWSAVTPHAYAAEYPASGDPIEVWRFLLTGTVMPLTMLLVGVAVLAPARATRALVALLLAIGGYSAFVSIMATHGPAALVWPSYALGHPEWPGRAVGVVYQPVVNGLVLVLGYLAALLVASRREAHRWARLAAALVAAACCYSVYLTFTRSAWLCLAVVVVLGVLVARGWRTGFVVTAAAGLVGVAANWSTFTSADRQAGGVTSSNELQDRLNINATALWATQQEPLTGWGIGRFPAVNTYHHQQLSPDVPWERGFGLASHLDVLGIAAELGLVGAALWLGIVGLVAAGLVRAVCRRPTAGAGEDAGDRERRDLATMALLAFVAWLVTGLTVDQRLFDVTNLMVLTLAGAAIGRDRRARPAPEPPRPTRSVPAVAA